MPKKKQEVAIQDSQGSEISISPRSLKVASKGIRTTTDFANMMAALMSDLIEGRVSPNVGDATCNAGAKLIKVVELQMKYGTEGQGNGIKTLTLADDSSFNEKLST
jgi:hypothetical protein